MEVGVAKMFNSFVLLEAENINCSKMAESEFAYETFFTIVMAVVDIIFALRIFMVAMGFRKLLFQMT